MLLTFQPFSRHVIIHVKNFPLKTAWLIESDNTSSYGAGLVVCPQASPTDGLLNFTLLRDDARSKILFLAFPGFASWITDSTKNVIYNRRKEVVIQTNRPVYVIVNEEKIIFTPFHVAILQRALKLVLTN